jgi:hypothetical protein
MNVAHVADRDDYTITRVLAHDGRHRFIVRWLPTNTLLVEQRGVHESLPDALREIADTLAAIEADMNG